MANVLTVTEFNTSAPWGTTANPTYTGCAVNENYYVIGYNTGLYTYDRINNVFTLRRNTTYRYLQLRVVNGHLYAITGASSSAYGALSIERINMETWIIEATTSISADSAPWNVIGRVTWYDDQYIRLCYMFNDGSSGYAGAMSIRIVYTNGLITSTQRATSFIGITYGLASIVDNFIPYNGRYYGIKRGYDRDPMTYYITNVVSFTDVRGGSNTSSYTNHTATGFTASTPVKMVKYDTHNAWVFNNANIYNYNFQTDAITSLSKTLSFNIYENAEAIKFSNGCAIFSGAKLAVLELKEYDLTYKIMNGDGTHEYVSITNAAPITAVRFGYANNVVSYIFTTLAGDINGSYTVIPPEDKRLTGFALYPNSSRVTFALNMDITTRFDDNASFYEVYEKYRPPATTFNINVYENTAEPNRVDKSSYLSTVATLSGALREQTSIINPSIIIQRTTLPRFNYVYIPEFHRYYFVVNITAVRMKLWQIDLKCDPLMTYKTGIGTLNAVIGRQENISNPDLIDTELPLEKENAITVQEITSTAFSTSSTGQVYNYVLTVVGA